MAQCPRCSADLLDGASYCMDCGAPTPTVLSAEQGVPSVTPPPPADDAPVDVRLARALGPAYDVRRMVGRGGFALVYEVWDRELERRLAVKVLDPEIAWTSGMLARFRQEARTLARLEHSAILTIHFVGQGQGLTWYAMPFIEGDSLSALLRDRGPFAPDKAVAIAMPVLDALAHAHREGLVHRDIKPDNILVERGSGRVLLVDFGIAKVLEPERASHKTATGITVGTPHYMSPEQGLGQGTLDGRSDLYAFGATLFQMVTGAPPFEGESSQEIVGKHVLEPVTPPVELNGRIPPWLSDVIVRCLAKKPADRFQTADDVIAALGEGPSEGAAAESPSTALGGDPRPEVRGAGSKSADESGRQSSEVGGGESRSTAAEADPTAKTIEGEGPALAPTPSGRRPRRRLVLAAAITFPVLLGAAGWWLLIANRARVAVTNALVEPVEVLVDGRVRDTVPAGGERTVRVARRGAAQLSWRMIRPALPDGTPLGVDLAAVWPTPPTRPRRARQVVRAEMGGVPMVAPLITNPTSRDLTAVVNAGTGAAKRCDCLIPAGSERVHIGYYPLYANTVVRFFDAASPLVAARRQGRYLDVGGIAELADVTSGAAVVEVQPQNRR